MTKAQFLSSIVVLSLSGIAAAQTEHPHLLFTPQKVAAIRPQLAGPYKDVWQVIQQRADLFTSASPPSMDVAGRQSSALGSDNWQMYVAGSLPYVASAYLMTAQSKYLAAAKQRSLAVCAYPHWGRDYDLEAGYCLFGIAMVYDWLYADLDRATRDTLRQTLLQRGQRLYRMIPTSYWTNWDLQNHQWVALAGLAAAGFALTDDPKAGDEARQWTSTCLRRFQQSDAELQPDGSTQEGMSYWSIGIDGMLKFWALAEHAQGPKPRQPLVGPDGLLPSVPQPAPSRLDEDRQGCRFRRLSALRLVRPGLPHPPPGADESRSVPSMVWQRKSGHERCRSNVGQLAEPRLARPHPFVHRAHGGDRPAADPAALPRHGRRLGP